MEAMIGFALETLSSLIQNELVSFLRVDAEMSRLSSTLTAIKAVLEDAEEKQFTNKVIKDWLRKLRDVADSLDDIFDEISTHALSLESQGKVQGSCFCYLNPTHVKFRHKMAKKLKDISQRLDEIDKERSMFDLRVNFHEERRNKVKEWRQTMSKTQPQFYGREAEKEKIVDFLVGGASNLEDLSVYPIVGMGGLGKTTLAQQVFNNERVVHHFLQQRFWVCVSDDFSLTRLLKAIIESAGHKCIYSDLEPLQKQVQEVVGGKRYLLVLDDVWNDNMEEWNRLKSVLACGSKGASILITTRLPVVAEITRTVHPHHLSSLSEDDCCELFKQQAFGPLVDEHPDLMVIGKEIVKKCKGVPLAAKTLGSLLRFKRDEKDWFRIKESEIWNLPQIEEQKEGSILPALRLSYLNLTAKSRRCFGFLAAFPKDTRMSKKHVIELWMANGFIAADKCFEVEEDGNRVWDELCLRSFFEDVEIDENDDKWFKMHDLVHDLAQFVMEDVCCGSTFKNGLPAKSTHHLSFYGDHRFQIQWSPHLHKFKSLKTIISRSSFEDNPFCDKFLKCYGLRALDLKSLREVPSSIGQLRHLRYLNLSHGAFTELPDSICKLWNLQILYLNECRSLKMLPDQLKCLKSLRHLHLEGCWSLRRLAPEMGQLRCLKTLDRYIVGVQEGFLLEELGNLKLEGTLRIKHLERVTSVTDAKKVKLAEKRLNELELSWERNEQTQPWESEEKVLEVLEPRRELKSLVIRGYLGAQLPQWMANPTIKDISCLTLEGCENVVRISFLVKLGCLKRLRLSNMNHVQYIDDECYVDEVERGFQALEDVTLERLPSLVKLSREEGGDHMFPRLTTLKITECPELNLPFLPSVTQLQGKGAGC